MNFKETQKIILISEDCWNCVIRGQGIRGKKQRVLGKQQIYQAKKELYFA